MSKLWVVKDIPESAIKCWEYEVGDIELILQSHDNKPLIMITLSEEEYQESYHTVQHLGIQVRIEESEEFYDKYFATLKDYKYLKNNKLNRKLYECVGENGDYFVGRKI